MLQFTPPVAHPPATMHAPAPRSYAIPPDRTTAIVRQAIARLAPVTRTRGTVSCAVIGDSIGVGVGGVLRGCMTVATKGIGSYVISTRTPHVDGGYVAISAGANDPMNPDLEANLEAIRARTGASRIVWIAPRHPRAAAVVASVAARHGDRVISLYSIATRDGTHPASYPTLGSMVRKQLGI